MREHPDPIYIYVGHAGDVHTICLHPTSRQMHRIPLTIVTLTIERPSIPTDEQLILSAMMLTGKTLLEVQKQGLVEWIPAGQNNRTILPCWTGTHEI